MNLTFEIILQKNRRCFQKTLRISRCFSKCFNISIVEQGERELFSSKLPSAIILLEPINWRADKHRKQLITVRHANCKELAKHDDDYLVMFGLDHIYRPLSLPMDVRLAIVTKSLLIFMLLRVWCKTALHSIGTSANRVVLGWKSCAAEILVQQLMKHLSYQNVWHWHKTKPRCKASDWLTDWLKQSRMYELRKWMSTCAGSWSGQCQVAHQCSKSKSGRTSYKIFYNISACFTHLLIVWQSKFSVPHVTILSAQHE